VAGGRKLVGSAMRRLGDSILQHGAILEGWDGTLQAGSLGLVDDSGLRPAVATLEELLGAAPSGAAVADAVAAGFASALEVSLCPSTLSRAERERAALLARERYGHERWTVGRQPELTS
jgi:lipoate-protein ligase A